MPRPPFPRNLREFQRQFATEEACQDYSGRLSLAGGVHLSPLPTRSRVSPDHGLDGGNVRPAAARSVVPLADRAIGNLQQWLIGTYHGVSKAQLPVYLDEFVFRHNRRRQPMAAFQTLLGLGKARTPTPYRQIRGARDVAED